MSRKNTIRKTDFSRSDHVDTALNMLMSSSESEQSDDSFMLDDNDWNDEDWINAKLDQIQNADTTDDILVCEPSINLCQQEAVQGKASKKMPVFLTSRHSPKPVSESPLPSPDLSQGISEAPPPLEPYDEMESLLSRHDEVSQGSNREPESNMDINIIMEVPSPVAEVEISNISDTLTTQPLPHQQQLSSTSTPTPTPIDQPSTSNNNIPRGPRPSYASVQNRQRVWTTKVDNWHAPSFDQPLRVKKDYNNRHIPRDYFMDIFPDSILQMIAINTNRYAHEKGSRGWTEVTKEEISAYLGIIILMT